MDEAFLGILRCPHSRTPLELADDTLLQRATAAQLDGQLIDRQGLPVESFETGLVDAERRWFYPVRNDIPSLIPDQAVDVASIPSLNDESKQALDKETESP